MYIYTHIYIYIYIYIYICVWRVRCYGPTLVWEKARGFWVSGAQHAAVNLKSFQLELHHGHLYDFEVS